MAEKRLWHDAWREGRIGFHRAEVNPALIQNAELFREGERILVPLCGKSLDMLWLRDRGCRVIGVELVEQAVQAFQDEHPAPVSCEAVGPYTAWHRDDGITILRGDVFALRREYTGPLTRWWDRAATVALPRELRVRYAGVLSEVLEPGAEGLISVIDYDPTVMEGPPFAVPRREIEELLGSWAELSLQEQASLLTPEREAAGHTFFDVYTWRATRR